MNRKAYYRQCVNELHQAHQPNRHFHQFRFNLSNGVSVSFKGFTQSALSDTGIVRKTPTFAPTGNGMHPLDNLQIVDAETGEPMTQDDWGDFDDGEDDEGES